MRSIWGSYLAIKELQKAYPPPKLRGIPIAIPIEGIPITKKCFGHKTIADAMHIDYFLHDLHDFVLRIRIQGQIKGFTGS